MIVEPDSSSPALNFFQIFTCSGYEIRYGAQVSLSLAPVNFPGEPARGLLVTGTGGKN